MASLSTNLELQLQHEPLSTITEQVISNLYTLHGIGSLFEIAQDQHVAFKKPILHCKGRSRP